MILVRPPRPAAGYLSFRAATASSMAADSDSGNESGGSSDSGPEEVHRRTAAISSAGDARWRRRMHLMEMAGASDASEDLSGGDGASGGSAGSVSGSEVSEDGMSDDGASPSDEDDGVVCSPLLGAGLMGQLSRHLACAPRPGNKSATRLGAKARTR